MLLRRAHLRPLETLAGVAVVRVGAQDLGVLDDGAVVVLQRFGALA
jgi:hypothetical protein